ALSVRFGDPVTVENFYRIQDGMTEEEVKNILGEPTRTFLAYIYDDGKTKQPVFGKEWTGPQVSIRVIIDNTTCQTPEGRIPMGNGVCGKEVHGSNIFAYWKRRLFR